MLVGEGFIISRCPFDTSTAHPTLGSPSSVSTVSRPWTLAVARLRRTQRRVCVTMVLGWGLTDIWRAADMAGKYIARW